MENKLILMSQNAKGKTALWKFMNTSFTSPDKVSLEEVKKFPHLKELLAAKNQLTTVPNFLLHKPYASALKKLGLGGNPFDCTCERELSPCHEL